MAAVIEPTTHQSATSGHRQKTGAAYLVVVVFATMMVQFLSAVDRSIFGIVLPRIKVDLHLPDAALGLLATAPFAVCFCLFSIPTAWLGDTRVKRTWVVGASMAVWSAMTALCGAAGGFWSLFFLRMGVGAGEAGGQPPALSIVADLAPDRWRRRLIAFCGLGAMFGIALGVAMAGLAVAAFGWRATFVLLGAPGVVAAVLYVLLVKEPPREQATGGARNVILEMRKLFSSQAFLMLFIGVGFSTCLSASVGAWMPTYLSRTQHASLAEIGLTLGALSLVAGFAGPPLFAWIGDRLATVDERWPFRLCAVNLFAGTAFLETSLMLHDKAAIYALLGAAQFLMLGASPLTTAAAQEAMPELKSVSVATMALGAVLISSFAPWAVGAISDASAGHGDGESLRQGLMAVTPVGLLGVAAYWAAARFRARERRVRLGAAAALS